MVRALVLALAAAISAFSVRADDAMVADSALAALYLKTEIAERVVAEAAKLAGEDAALGAEVGSAARNYRARVMDDVRARLLELYPDEDAARKGYGAFVERFARTATAEERSAVVTRDLAGDVASAGNFLGDVQSWLRIRGRGDAPPLTAWLARDRTGGAAAAVAAKPRRKRNSLRDAEAAAGTFVEAKDDGDGSLRSFGAQRKARREKRLAEAQQGMEQVAAERKAADDEANARKLAKAQAEAAAQQAQAQRLAAVEQEAVVQDQNSWKTRLKGVLSSAIGATTGAFTGGIGTQIGTAAADAVLGNHRR